MLSLDADVHGYLLLRDIGRRLEHVIQVSEVRKVQEDPFLGVQGEQLGDHGRMMC